MAVRFRILTLFIVAGIALPTRAFSHDELEDQRFRTIQKVDSLNDFARRFTYINPISATEAANEALLLATEYGYEFGKGYAFRNLGGLYSAAENFSLSMEFLQQALDIFSSANDSVGIANCYITFGHTYRRLGKRESEYFYHKSALDIFTRAGLVERKAVALHNLGETLFLMDSLSRARDLTLQANVVLDSLKLYDITSNCYKVLGQIALKNLDMVEAERNFNKVLEISLRLGQDSQKNALLEAYLQLAEIARIRGDRAITERNLRYAAEVSKNYLSIKQTLRVYTSLIQFYTNTGNVTNADLAGREFLQALQNEEIRQAGDRARLMELAVTAYSLKKTVSEMEMERKIQDAGIRFRNYLVGISLLFLGIVSVLLLQRQKAARKLEAVNNTLVQKQETILKQNEKLEVLNLTKDRFFGIVAHDLRAPLSSLKMFSDLSAEILSQMNEHELNTLFDSMGKSVDNTLKMADNLITWASLQMKDVQTNPSTFDLEDVFERVFSVYQDIAQQKNVALIFTIPKNISVYADINHLEFVIRNLVNNALKFTYPGGKITARVLETSPEKVVFCVEDSGVGMSAEKMAELFMIGRNRSTPGTGGEKGTGLGLLLIRDFLDMNRGTIFVSSTPGRGTTFILAIPRG